MVDTVDVYVRRFIKCLYLIDSAEFKEAEHPRDKDGKFTSGGGSSSSSSEKSKSGEVSKTLSDLHARKQKRREMAKELLAINNTKDKRYKESNDALEKYDTAREEAKKASKGKAGAEFRAKRDKLKKEYESAFDRWLESVRLSSDLGSKLYNDLADGWGLNRGAAGITSHFIKEEFDKLMKEVQEK